jgi:hypothetical protein
MAGKRREGRAVSLSAIGPATAGPFTAVRACRFEIAICDIKCGSNWRETRYGQLIAICDEFKPPGPSRLTLGHA